MEKLQTKLAANFDRMQATNKLFISSVSGNELWEIYLSTMGTDKKFRDPDSSAYNCNLCNNFMRRYGNVVAITDDFKILTIFDNIKDEEYGAACEALSKKLKKAPVANVFFESYEELRNLNYGPTNSNTAVFDLGIKNNHKVYTEEEASKFGNVVAGSVYTFNHMHVTLNKQFVIRESVDTVKGLMRSDFEVFKRTMETIPTDTYDTVVDLISQGALLNGATHESKVHTIKALKLTYDVISRSKVKKDLFCWLASYNLPLAKFRNELIGTLCVEIAETKDINAACLNWNKRADPVNYMRVSAPYSAKERQKAFEFVEEHGYLPSFTRRFATIDDINVEEILHVGNSDKPAKTASTFDALAPSTKTSKKTVKDNFQNVETISIDKFMQDILPKCASLEAYLENRHESNLVALTTADSKNSKSIFKWSNNFSWAYNGNLAGKSQIKNMVKSLGGKVDGPLRFSLSWNENGKSIVDLDLHAIVRTSKSGIDHIYYSTDYRKDRSNKRSPTSGQLDIDMIRPVDQGIENIAWTEKIDGVYECHILNYDRGINDGFKCEIEFDGQIYKYSHAGNYRSRRDREPDSNTLVAKVTLKNGVYSIEHVMPCENSEQTVKKLYNLDSNNFHKVNLACLSPNYWGENNTGNKHYFFMLEDCKTDQNVRSFFNENLNTELLEHRKVMEALGQATMLSPTDKQLCGLGFNATVNDDLLVKYKIGKTINVKRIIF